MSANELFSFGLIVLGIILGFFIAQIKAYLSPEAIQKQVNIKLEEEDGSEEGSDWEDEDEDSDDS